MWKRAVVTGASEGIGAAFARQLAAGGSDLVLVARRADVLGELSSVLQREHGVVAEALSADLATDAGLATVKKCVLGTEVDMLVNNVGGGGAFGPFTSLAPATIDEILALNVRSTLHLMSAVLPSMEERRRGHIINVSAGVAFYPLPMGATYAAAKALVTSLSEAVHEELRASGVVVTNVCPGFTRTRGPERAGYDTSTVPAWLWRSADEVARAALTGARKGQRTVSPGWENRLAATLGRVLPRTILLHVLDRMTDRLEKSAASA